MNRILGILFCLMLAGMARVAPGDKAASQAEGITAQQAEEKKIQAARETCPLEKLSIVTSDGQTHVFTIEIADDIDSQRKGLMFRTDLEVTSGMLFDFERNRQVHMWMKNTYIPLDMIFIASDGTIVNIEADAVPGSLQRRSSDGPVRAVLEINAGLSAALGLAPGDKITHPVFEQY